MIPNEAIDAAAKYLALMMVDPDGNYTIEATQLLEAVEPYAMWCQCCDRESKKVLCPNCDGICT